MEKALTFPKGSMYQIICKAGNQALKIEDLANHHNSRVVGTNPDIQDLAQIFFI